MSRRQKEPLRPLTAEERSQLHRLSRARSQPAAHVVRARQVLAVAEGHSYTAAAQSTGRRSGDAVAKLVARFNRAGLTAIEPGHGGGSPPTYGLAERERILAEFHRPPQLEQDGTATWSLSTLRRALRRAPDGLPQVSTYTIWCVLHDAGWTWQRARSWCHTGVARRVRKRGVVEVHDRDATAKKG